MHRDILVAGGGIAGSVLAYTLKQQGFDVVLADDEPVVSSSLVAAGILNPITGRNWVKTWLADELFPFAWSFYRSLEKQLDVKILSEKRVYRPFHAMEEENSITAKSADALYAHYLSYDKSSLYDQLLHHHVGGMFINRSGMIGTGKLLHAVHTNFKQRNRFIQKKVITDHLFNVHQKWQWEGFSFDKIVFCEGLGITQNTYFKHLPVVPFWGDILMVEIPGLPMDRIVNRGVFLAPSAETAVFKTGSTYIRGQFAKPEDSPGRLEIETKLKELLKIPFRVLSHTGSARPACPDRRPMIGEHPTEKGLFVFNGLGSKGVSLAPYISLQMAEMLDGKSVLPALHVSRF